MAADKRTRRERKKRRRWPYWAGGILLLVVLVAGGYMYYLYSQLNSTIEDIQEPVVDPEQTEEQQQEQEQEMEEAKQMVEDKKTLNILLLGVDEREGDQGRSDTMIFMSVNPDTESILMFSIPRDSRVEIPGIGMDKINHAYAYGGSTLAVETVENLLDVPVHFYVRVNMEGFRQGINALGGITVQNEFEFTQDGVHFPAGELALNGEEALLYARMRKEDPDGDIGRTERQRQVLQAAMNQVASFSGISKINNILSIVSDNVRTNMDAEVIRNLFFNYRQARQEMEIMHIEGQGGILSDGVWYYQVTDEEWTRIREAILAHMEDPAQ